MSTQVFYRFFDIKKGHKIFNKKVMARLTERDDVTTPLLRGAPRLGLALGPAPARAGHVYMA